MPMLGRKEAKCKAHVTGMEDALLIVGQVAKDAYWREAEITFRYCNVDAETGRVPSRPSPPARSNLFHVRCPCSWVV
jgi:hypothetical protein